MKVENREMLCDIETWNPVIKPVNVVYAMTASLISISHVQWIAGEFGKGHMVMSMHVCDDLRWTQIHKGSV